MTIPPHLRLGSRGVALLVLALLACGVASLPAAERDSVNEALAHALGTVGSDSVAQAPEGALEWRTPGGGIGMLVRSELLATEVGAPAVGLCVGCDIAARWLPRDHSLVLGVRATTLTDRTGPERRDQPVCERPVLRLGESRHHLFECMIGSQPLLHQGEWRQGVDLGMTYVRSF